MKNTYIIDVKSSKFGKCKLTFRGPTHMLDTNHYIYNSKDPNRYIRVWYYSTIGYWACEIHDREKRTYRSYGCEMLDGTYSFASAKSAWQFISKEYW